MSDNLKRAVWRFARGLLAAAAAAALVYASSEIANSPEANDLLGAGGIAILTAVFLAADKWLRVNG